MRITLKDIIKLAVTLALTGFVVYKTSNNVDWGKAKDGILKFNYGWIFLSVLLSLISHYLRAYRWQLLLKTKNYNPGATTTFLAVMVCYLGNMALPRLGEFMRGSILKEHKNIPLSFSLGTVITDRLLDLMVLIFLALFLFVKEFQRLKSFLFDFIDTKVPILQTLWPYLLGAGVLFFIILGLVIRRSKASGSDNSISRKIVHFIRDMMEGLKAIRLVRNQMALWLSTLGIWILYFLMLYVISFGYDPTDDLSLMAGVAVLVMGSLGMAAPVNSGIGTYQAFVASILVAFGIVYEDGYIFAVISHGSQVVAVLIIGFLSLLILNFRKKQTSETNSK